MDAPLPTWPIKKWIRISLAGFLMGLANLVPGISGGTMIVVMGLYDEFVSTLADLTRLRFNRRNLLFAALILAAAIVAIGGFAGTLSHAVRHHRSAMFALFIGMTLGGVPLLLRMLGRITAPAIIGSAIGLALMIAVAASGVERPNRKEITASVEAGRLMVEPNYPRDVLAGILGLSAMVLPGISGAYLLLIIGRYEAILTAISLCKAYLSGGTGAAGEFRAILVPTALGALIGLVTLSNLLKWMLSRYKRFTLGLLLGVLAGSVVGIWPLHAESTTFDMMICLLLAMAGFAVTALLGRIGNPVAKSEVSERADRFPADSSVHGPPSPPAS